MNISKIKKLLNFLFMLVLLTILNSCSCSKNQTKTQLTSKKDDTKKHLKSKQHEELIKPKNKDLDEKTIKKDHITTIPTQRGLIFSSPSRNTLLMLPTGASAQVMLKDKRKNILTPFIIKNKILLDVSDFAPGGYDVFLIKDKNKPQINFLLNKNGQNLNTTQNTLISESLWFVLIDNKEIRYFEDMGNGECWYFPRFTNNQFSNRATLFSSKVNKRYINFDQLAPRNAKYISFHFFASATSHLPPNSYIDFLYDTLDIEKSKKIKHNAKRVHFISGLPEKQYYTSTFEIPIIHDSSYYNPRRYLYYKISSSLTQTNHITFNVFVKGWKMNYKYGIL